MVALTDGGQPVNDRSRPGPLRKSARGFVTLSEMPAVRRSKPPGERWIGWGRPLGHSVRRRRLAPFHRDKVNGTPPSAPTFSSRSKPFVQSVRRRRSNALHVSSLIRSARLNRSESPHLLTRFGASIFLDRFFRPGEQRERIAMPTAICGARFVNNVLSRRETFRISFPVAITRCCGAKER